MGFGMGFCCCGGGSSPSASCLGCTLGLSTLTLSYTKGSNRCSSIEFIDLTFPVGQVFTWSTLASGDYTLTYFDSSSPYRSQSSLAPGGFLDINKGYAWTGATIHSDVEYDYIEGVMFGCEWTTSGNGGDVGPWAMGLFAQSKTTGTIYITKLLRKNPNVCTLLNFNDSVESIFQDIDDGDYTVCDPYFVLARTGASSVVEINE